MDMTPSPQGVPSLLGAGRGNFLADRSAPVAGGGPPPADPAALKFNVASNSQYLGTV